MYFLTAIHTEGGETEAHVTNFRWLNSTSGVAGTSSTANMVAWLEKGNSLFVGGPDGKVSVGVVRPAAGTPYLRSFANKQWTDNLKALPRF